MAVHSDAIKRSWRLLLEAILRGVVRRWRLRPKMHWRDAEASRQKKGVSI